MVMSAREGQMRELTAGKLRTRHKSLRFHRPYCANEPSSHSAPLADLTIVPAEPTATNVPLP